MRISKAEFEEFSKLLAHRFELTEDKKFETSLASLEAILGQPLLVHTKSEDVNKVSSKALLDNQIVFLAKTKKKAVYYLAKHFRNCASHAGRITKKKVGDKIVYLFRDEYNHKTTMQCRLSKDTLVQLVDKMYE